MRSLPSQMPWMTFRPTLAASARHLVEAVFDRIGAHAIRQTGQFRQIIFDLPRLDADIVIERRLIGRERGIGHALDALGIGGGHLPGATKLPPGSRDQRGCDDKGNDRAPLGHRWLMARQMSNPKRNPCTLPATRRHVGVGSTFAALRLDKKTNPVVFDRTRTGAPRVVLRGRSSVG